MIDEFDGAYAPQNQAASLMDPVWRNHMDARRSSWRRLPESEYPSGYLGTITNRRADRLLQAAGKQMNRKAYDRGVHKGERMDQGDYFWPEEFSPWKGLDAVARGIRQTPIGTFEERRLVNDGKVNTLPVPVDAARAAALSDHRPRWH